MPRRVPNSHKKRKDKLKQARAVKRGDADPASLAPKQKYSRGPSRSDRAHENAAARALESRFIRLPPAYVERSRHAAYSEPLVRPVPPSACVFPLAHDGSLASELACPVRPRYKDGATAKEVTRNEEGAFKRWKENCSAVVDRHVEQGGSPSWFEANLEVWRQLWRVTETSSILIILLDSRCPPLHLPPSLCAYLRRARVPVIFALTKSDLVDPRAVELWRDWARQHWADEVDVVPVRSYDEELLKDGRHKPFMPDHSRQELMAALKRAHERVLAAAPGQAGSSTAPRRDIDWDLLSCSTDVLDATEDGHAAVGEPSTYADSLTVGLVGQPNVGKSSLLNALLGTTRVRASRTPGKHFQTIFFGPSRELKIVDCPGLVCPSLVPMELQTLAGILQISQIPSLLSCIHFAARVMPLETIFRIPPPPQDEFVDKYAGKRTYRAAPAAAPAPGFVSSEGVDVPLEDAEPPVAPTESRAGRPIVWTAGSMLESRAENRGFMTAQSGRPDTTRAADANGRVRWGFWPVPGREGLGIWEGDGDADVDEERHDKPVEADADTRDDNVEVEEDEDCEDGLSFEDDFDDEDEAEGHEDAHETDDDGEVDEARRPPVTRGSGAGFFAALDEGDESAVEHDDEEVKEEEVTEEEPRGVVAQGS